MPGTNGFVGEFLVLIGSFRTEPIFAVIATTAVIFAAAYLLWAHAAHHLFNPLDKPENEHVPDLNRRELAVMLMPLVASRSSGSAFIRRRCSNACRVPPRNSSVRWTPAAT